MIKFKTFLKILENKKEDELKDTTSWKKVGGQMGSNPGGVYEDENKKRWYVKHSKSDDHAKNEMLANHFYRHLGVPTPDHELIRHEENLGTASPMMKITNYDPDSEDDRKEIKKHFASHAFLANWDSVGNGEDNQAHSPKGMTTIDAGGALNYRAQGSPKGNAFGDKAGEWDSFRDKKLNRTSHKVYGDITPQEMIESSKKVAELKNKTIHKLVHTHGPGNKIEKNALSLKLQNRKKDIINRANILAKTHGLDPIKDIDEE